MIQMSAMRTNCHIWVRKIGGTRAHQIVWRVCEISERTVAYILVAIIGVSMMKWLRALVLVAAFGDVEATAAPLDDAAKSGDLALITQLLDEGADINAASTFGTALHWASLNGHAAAAKLLVARGANIDTLSNSLGSPLFAATRRNHASVARALIEAGAAPDLQNPADGFTPLQLAALEGYIATAMVLIEGGADVNAVSEIDGSTRWGTGTTSVLHLAVRHGHPDVVNALRDAGAKPTAIISIEASLPNANPANGGRIAQAHCSRCHAVTSGATDPTVNSAPSLVGVSGRSVASVDGHEYSRALMQFGGRWTPNRLYSFIQHPKLVVPGTEMVQDPELSNSDLIDLVAYLVDLPN